MEFTKGCGAFQNRSALGIPFTGRLGTLMLLLFGSVLFVGLVLPGNSMAEDVKADTKADARAKFLKTFVAEFVAITPGKGKFPESFEMGSTNGAASELPVRKVTFGYSFGMAKYEVPQDLYSAVMGKNPSVWGGPRNSTEMMNYREAVGFCQRVTKLLHDAKLIGDDEVIRLPTEAEWEYCCRAGTTTAFSFGNEATSKDDVGKKASKLDPYGWHTGNAAGNDPPVGALKPNAWGLYDFHGYLWEFVSDSWHPNYKGAPTDGSSWASADESQPRTIRGGSWRDRHELLRSATRWSLPDHVRSDAIGFRCVKSKRSPK